MAAALGNYPTPIVGYGGSAIMGYALSLLALPKLAGNEAREVNRSGPKMGPTPSDNHFFVGMA